MAFQSPQKYPSKGRLAEGNDLKKAALDSGVHLEAITPEGAFKPYYDEEGLDTIMPSICYTPTAPGIEELEVINFSLVLEKICV